MAKCRWCRQTMTPRPRKKFHSRACKNEAAKAKRMFTNAMEKDALAVIRLWFAECRDVGAVEGLSGETVSQAPETPVGASGDG